MEQAKLSATARREQMAARFKQGGDKYESIRADEAQDIIEAEQERLRVMGIVDISEGNMRCQECGTPSTDDNEYFKEWRTCNSYCYGKLVGVYY